VLNRGQLEEFAQRGFLVLPGVVPQALVDAAARAIDELIDREPPGAGAGTGRAADRQPGVRAGRGAGRARDAGGA